MSSSPTSNAQAPIGVFDSGVGGLTVTRAIVDGLPNEALLYFGDTARVPYGNKSPNTVQRYSLNIAGRLNDAGVKAIVVACNTVSATGAVGLIRDSFGLPVIGVIEPVAALAAERSRTRCVGVIGTRGTISSGAYERALHRHDPDLEIHAAACPLFVPLAEEGWLAGHVPRDVAFAYLSAFADTEIDTLILGCTHYPLLRKVIKAVIDEVTGRDVEVLDSATATTEALGEVLAKGHLSRPAGASSPVHRFWVTDAVESFCQVSDLFFGAPLGHVEHVDL